MLFPVYLLLQLLSEMVLVIHCCIFHLALLPWCLLRLPLHVLHLRLLQLILLSLLPYLRLLQLCLLHLLHVGLLQLLCLLLC